MRECLEEIGLPQIALPAALSHQVEANARICALIAGYRRDYPARSILKLEGEETNSIYLVLSGWLLTSKTMADGQRQIVDVILPSGIVEPASADPNTSAVEIETLTDNSIAVIPRQEWRRACVEYPELAELGHQIVAEAFSRICERMLRLGKAPAETMIAFVLCELFLRSSTRRLVDGAKFHIPMTQQQLGDLCGLSAVHICRTLRRLKRNGVLDVTDHMDIVVHDMQALVEIAKIDLEELHREILSAV